MLSSAAALCFLPLLLVIVRVTYLHQPPTPADSEIMAHSYIKGNKVLLPNTEKPVPAVIEIQGGRIKAIHSTQATIAAFNTQAAGDGSIRLLTEVGDNILMPGLVDSHVHVNEPGRTDWEGFYTATRAAAAGGITTIVDMPLNSIPPTTTVDNLQVKLEAATGQCHVDVGFWGGVIPGNEGELKEMVARGVVGFKCFLIHSGVDEFPCVNRQQVELALDTLKGTGSLLAFHAEVEVGSGNVTGDPAEFETFLKTRPPEMEFKAIQLVAECCKKVKDVRCHIVHLSAAEAIPIISSLKSEGYALTVETCPHYLTLSSEEITPKSTQFKSCPPIRNSTNQALLWKGLKRGIIDLVVSDHSPCTAQLKLPGEKDFMEAWGGISSIQFTLPVVWTKAQELGHSFADISLWMSKKPAELVGFAHRKGEIKVGYDADFVVWNPEGKVEIDDALIQYKNKLSPYKGKTLKGKVLKTILRGELIYEDGKFPTEKPKGQFVFPNK